MLKVRVINFSLGIGCSRKIVTRAPFKVVAVVDNVVLLIKDKFGLTISELIEC